MYAEWWHGYASAHGANLELSDEVGSIALLRKSDFESGDAGLQLLLGAHDAAIANALAAGNAGNGGWGRKFDVPVVAIDNGRYIIDRLPAAIVDVDADVCLLAGLKYAIAVVVGKFYVANLQAG